MEDVVPITNHLGDDNAIFFPRTLSAGDPAEIFRFCSQIEASSGNVVLDASQLIFIDPFGLASLRATLECQANGREFYVRWMRNSMISYLVRMDFFLGLSVEGCDVQTGRNPMGEPDNCVELLKVSETAQSEEIASRLVHAMTGVKDDPSAAEAMEPYRRPLEYALKELLENSLSHAKREGNFGASVWVACQHFALPDMVRLAIVDNGCGFLATLQNHAKLTEKTHGAAIQAALIERVSCNRGPLTGYDTDSENQGVGLTTTAKIASAAEGYLVIASGDAWVKTDCDYVGRLPDSSWKGVAISFTCKRERLPQVDISSLLPKVEGHLDSEIQFQ